MMRAGSRPAATAPCPVVALGGSAAISRVRYPNWRHGREGGRSRQGGRRTVLRCLSRRGGGWRTVDEIRDRHPAYFVVWRNDQCPMLTVQSLLPLDEGHPR